MARPTYDFLTAVDYAREEFLKAAGGDLRLRLLGVKIVNLLITKHEYRHGYVRKSGRPIGFLVDPANQCHLGCPSCTNTFNRSYADAAFDAWPPGLMKPDVFDALIENVGPYAFAGMFYNKHEPFLNKLTPSFMRAATDFGLQTSISTNLSFSKLDAEAIVLSGLTELMVAADGVTQPVYERYRRGGRIDWVFANVRAIADAKIKLRSQTPHIRWQYLTFRHNLHEVTDALRQAESLGFDEFNLATPYDVSMDDPSVIACDYEGPPEHRRASFRPRTSRALGNPERYAEHINAAIRESASDRWRSEIGDDQRRKAADRCDWLHMTVTVDAFGSVRPCCLGDYKDHGRFVLADLRHDKGGLMNSPGYRQAREALLDPTTYKQKLHKPVRCDSCLGRPPPQIGLHTVADFLARNRDLAGFTFLRDWSAHADAPGTPFAPG